ncbi:MAG: WYL domain-containing protein [Acidobacteria bacterium]|nr:WYL domain-containing protein [Acidobacteriota bacterium]
MAVEPTERVTNLIALLKGTRLPLTLEQILFELGDQYPEGASNSRATFERDKAVLRELGVPVETTVLTGEDAGRTAYRIDPRRYELADLDLTDEERQALQLAAAAWHVTDTRFGILKLGGEGLAGHSVSANVPELPSLPTLRQAAVARAEVSFSYSGKPRRLWPYSLLLRDGFWYVIGFDVDAGEVRTYRPDRIEGDLALGDAGMFERPEGFDARDAFPADPRLLGGEPEARAVVRIDAPRSVRAMQSARPEEVVAQHSDGSVELDVPCANLDAFRSWLFGFGEHAEVVGPPEVRSAVVEWLEQMVAQA